MNVRVLVIGGYGNFGRFICRSLADERNIQLIIAGRSIDKARLLSTELDATNPAKYAALDIHSNLNEALEELKPDIVIHTSGPFQPQGYEVARACLHCNAHYIDLADAREFVEGIGVLDEQARKQQRLVVSGASSVPCLTSAIVDHFQPQFSRIDSLDYAITTAQKTTRGLATTAAILGYTGKPFLTKVNGEFRNIYGWQSLHKRKYRSLGWRLLGNCDIPDLALFPKRYPDIHTIRFYAGLELPFIHITLWLLSWLVRARLVSSLQPAASLMLKSSFLFDWLGSENSAFHMELSGECLDKKPQNVVFELTAKSGDGPYIPCMPAILLAKKLANNQISNFAAQPCVGLITLNEYLAALNHLDIETTAL